MKKIICLLFIFFTVIFITLLYVHYEQTIKCYKKTEILMCDFSTNIIYNVENNNIYDSWGNEIKRNIGSDTCFKVVSAGRDGKYWTSDDIIGTVNKSNYGWLLVIEWHYWIDSSSTCYCVHFTED